MGSNPTATANDERSSRAHFPGGPLIVVEGRSGIWEERAQRATVPTATGSATSEGRPAGAPFVVWRWCVYAGRSPSPILDAVGLLTYCRRLARCR